ncbi:MAG TPA: sigma-70 family RNA polymerase sigma factor, partial [Abditibacteriaceae bacterium]
AAYNDAGSSASTGTRSRPGGRRSFPHDETTLLNLFRRLNGPSEGLRGGDREAVRDRLVLAHTPLVEHCARAFTATGEPIEDLVQEGYIGLIKAVDRFDPDKGVRFSTYACHLISGEMRHYLRDLGKLIHEPGWHAQLRSRVIRESETLTQKLGRPPLPEEIASALDMQPQIVRAVIDTQNVLSVESLDGGDSDDSGEGARGPSEDRAGTNHVTQALAANPISTHVENHMLLDNALPQLRELEQKAIRLFYYQECTKTEIARQLGISVNYASYLVKRGIEHLRRIIEEGETVRENQALAETKNLVRLENLAAWIEREGNFKPGKELSLVVFRIQNWDSATQRLSTDARAEAEAAAEAVTRRCCRLSDKLVSLTGDSLIGCHFVALLPNTGIKGRRVGERWVDNCTSHAVSPNNPALVDALLVDYAFVTFPEDGADASALATALLAQL